MEKCQIKPPKILNDILIPIKKLCKNMQIEPQHFLICSRNKLPAVEIAGVTTTGNRIFAVAYMKQIENKLIEIFIKK